MTEVWGKLKKLWKHSPVARVPRVFLVLLNFTRVSVTQQKHGTCFLFHKHNMVMNTNKELQQNKES